MGKNENLDFQTLIPPHLSPEFYIFIKMAVGVQTSSCTYVFIASPFTTAKGGDNPNDLQWMDEQIGAYAFTGMQFHHGEE